MAGDSGRFTPEMEEEEKLGATGAELKHPLEASKGGRAQSFLSAVAFPFVMFDEDTLRRRQVGGALSL